MTALNFGESINNEDHKFPVTVNPIKKYIKKRNSKGDPLWYNIPILIAQLPKHKIAEDLNILLKV